MRKGNTSSDANEANGTCVPGKVGAARANATPGTNTMDNSNAASSAGANVPSGSNVMGGADAPGKAGANMADAAVSSGAANVASSADAEGPSCPTGASVPGNIARAYEALDSFWREQNQLYRDVAASFGISESAFSILYAIFLAGEKGIAQRDICMQMCIGKQTVNSSIHKLEREGVVVLESGPGRRGLLAHLTPAGRKFAERTVAPMIEAELAALREFDDSELELSLFLGRRYTDALRAHFSAIPGVRLTSPSGKIAVQDGGVAPRGAKAVARKGEPALQGGRPTGCDGGDAPSGGRSALSVGHSLQSSEKVR
ncbi:MarR family winged helix-turn-helix transcriptional regulator [Ellagibacter isourolithinifaciens]|uniref:MarR family winged helix-turn-helix transcriptional regulator n=1 Tax=Ellagibacter isourolithinifaciens TaxID=2137581 RepID=UPI003AF1477C